MKTKKMRGGIEWPVISVALVFVGLFVLTLTIGFYFRSVLVGEPIEIRTYTEYRWMNYFPSSVLFYLSYSPQSWNALNELAKMEYSKKEVLSRKEFVDRYSSEVDLTEYNELMDKLEEKTKKRDNSYIIKDKKGLIISLGLPRDKLEGLIVSFPEEYPYNCFYKDMPIFSKETKNMRIKFVYCCGDIKECSAYLTGPGRSECNNDPCGVGSCKLVICEGDSNIEKCKVEEPGTRICLKNNPPEVKDFGVRFEGRSKWDKTIEKEFEGDTKLEFFIKVTDDFDIDEIILDYDDGSYDTEFSPTDSYYEFNHTYTKKGDYKITFTVIDDGKNEWNNKDNKLSVKLT